MNTEQIIYAGTWVGLLAFVLEYKFESYARSMEDKLVKVASFAMLCMLLLGQGLLVATNSTDATLEHVLRYAAGTVLLGTLALFVYVFSLQAWGQVSANMKDSEGGVLSKTASFWLAPNLDKSRTERGAAREKRGGLGMSLSWRAARETARDSNLRDSNLTRTTAMAPSLDTVGEAQISTKEKTGGISLAWLFRKKCDESAQAISAPARRPVVAGEGGSTTVGAVALAVEHNPMHLSMADMTSLRHDGKSGQPCTGIPAFGASEGDVQGSAEVDVIEAVLTCDDLGFDASSVARPRDSEL